MEDYPVLFLKLCQTRTSSLASVTVLISFIVVLVFQTITLPSGNASPPLFSTGRTPELGNMSFPNEDSSRSKGAGEGSFSSDSENFTNSSQVNKEVERSEVSDEGVKFHHNDKIKEKDGVVLKNGSITLEHTRNAEQDILIDRVSKTNATIESERIKNPDDNSTSPSPTSPPSVSYMNENMQGILDSNISSLDKLATEKLPKSEQTIPPRSGPATSIMNSTVASDHQRKRNKKRVKQVMPTMSISEMNSLLLRNHASSQSMIPLWPSDRDQEILDAKAQIQNAPIVKNDQELYAPLFRNISTFKRSYELMEQTLKVYVYMEGEKPIFHQPWLEGIYASEGWFMKLMEGNTHFIVKDPRKAHLFYMPFSSRLLEVTLYVPGSHSHRNLIEYLNNYIRTIAAKYPFWNRTDGADHFLAACHDWAPHETEQNMESSIRALCNADVSEGFEIGKDVSLPETYVRSEQNPLRDLGGRPVKKRPNLAFFAGNMHGYLRPILLQHWENKDPDMKIFGPMPRGRKKKNTYIQYMKTSKYCICPKGYEVNSPRVVEAIFYECVPVIISDNFVPPFFEVLNWDAFSIIVVEKDVPRLKEILVSIPRKKYLSLQMGVRKVQQHFLWHKQPMKYDLFHMTLHSIWFNRVNQIRIR